MAIIIIIIEDYDFLYHSGTDSLMYYSVIVMNNSKHTSTTIKRENSERCAHVLSYRLDL